MDKEWRRRHPDFESFDHIELEVVPRFKTSGLSGDEWRTSVKAKFSFKGVVVHEQSFISMRVAVMMLPHAWLSAQEPIPESVIEIEKNKCYQPGCKEDHVSKYRLKRLTSATGEYLHEDEGKFTKNHVRRFCETHRHRGNASREDSDANYEVLDTKTSDPGKKKKKK